MRDSPPSDHRRRLPWLSILIVAALAIAAIWFLTDRRLGAVASTLDTDGSGVLEQDELGVRMRERFAQIDADGSGTIDGVEFRRWLLVQWWSGRTRAVPVPPLPPRPDGDALVRWLQAPVSEGHLEGVALAVIVDGEVVFRHVEGRLGAAEAVPLGALSAWPAAAVFACLEERGELDLAAPLGLQSDRAPLAWSERSFVELLSHTSGAAAGVAPVVPAETSLSTAGRDLARAFPPVAPGTSVRFGTAGPQIAGWLAEEITGRRWRRLFIECLAWPLSLGSATWGHPAEGPARAGHVDLSTGLWMSLDDYADFLAMLQDGGRFAGVPNLGAAAMRVMEMDRVGDLPREALPAGVDPAWGHALGAWCERVDASGRCTVLSATGAFGAHAWLDRERDVAAVLLVVDAQTRVDAWSRETRRLVERIYGRAILGAADADREEALAVIAIAPEVVTSGARLPRGGG